MNARQFLLAAAASLLLAACKQEQAGVAGLPPTAQTQDAYIHAASSMTFPRTVADFQREKITRFNAAGTDIGVGYNLLSPNIAVAATVYVYPAPSLISIGSPPEVVASARSRLCASEFERRKNEMVQVHPGARLIDEGAAPPPGGGAWAPGHRAAFELEELFGGRVQRVRSELYVFCYIGGKWAFEYRFTSPQAVEASGAISSFIAGLPWTGQAQ